MKLKIFFIITGLILISSNAAFGWVYSIDSLIDVNRMAVDKMYYDLYYNPRTSLFSRLDLITLSQEAIALVNGAIESRVDRAQHADYANQSVYNTGGTGISFCFGKDPYIGFNGTQTNPEIQDPVKPNCIYGGALFADENIGYVHTIDKAYKTINAKEVTDSFQADKFNKPVPRAFEAPSSNYTWYGDNYIVYNDSNMKWKDGVPIGLQVMNWTGSCPGGYVPNTNPPVRCFQVVDNNTEIPLKVDQAYWADKSFRVSILGKVDWDLVTIDKSEITLNKNEQATIQKRHYTFKINNFTVTKNNVLFCGPGWNTTKWLSTTASPGLCSSGTCSVDYCGGVLEYKDEGCIEWDRSNLPNNCSMFCYPNSGCVCFCSVSGGQASSCEEVGVTPPPCKTSKYSYRAVNACVDSAGVCLDGGENPCNDQTGECQTGSIFISSETYGPVTISIDTNGNDERFEPQNLSKNTKAIYQAAQEQLPDLVYYDVNNGIKFKNIVRCDGKPGAYSNCKPLFYY